MFNMQQSRRQILKKEMFSRIIFPSGSWSYRFRNISCSSNHLSCKETNFYIRQSPSLSSIQCRWKSTNGDQESLSKFKESENVQLTVAEKVKQTTKDAGYLGIIIAGIGVTGIMFYAILRELFSGHSPSSIYSDALKICRSNSNVLDVLGEPIKGYGEMSSWRRRRHVSHFQYEKEGKNYIRLKFYVQGSRKSGTVHLEMVEGEKGRYEYRYLFVDVDGYSPRSIILQDNRHLDKNLEINTNIEN